MRDEYRRLRQSKPSNILIPIKLFRPLTLSNPGWVVA